MSVMRPTAALTAAALLAAGMLAGTCLGQSSEAPAVPEAPAAFFRPDDVLALVGGEDTVVLRDEPEFELCVLRQPGLATVRFRNLAFEGDTVFEQFRELNFPSWEDQLQSVGTTVVVAQFGRMESLAGPAGVPAFAAAYEAFIARLAGDTRRVLLLAARPPHGAPPESVAPYNQAARALARRRGWSYADTPAHPLEAAALMPLGLDPGPPSTPAQRSLVRRKNMLWFHYWRPQNWAFLHGDRTEQQSSRDHRDPSKRWFPDEMLQWLPLVATREAEIRQSLEAERTP